MYLEIICRYYKYIYNYVATFLTLQAGPLDYFSDQFYVNRKELVDSHLQWLSSASPEVCQILHH